MGSAPAWAAGLIFIVTLMVISIVGTYDRSRSALISQPGKLAAAPATYPQATLGSTGGTLAAGSAMSWMQDVLTRLRQDDRVAEAIRDQRALARDDGERPAKRLELIVPAHTSPAVGSAAGASAAPEPGSGNTIAVAAAGAAVGAPDAGGRRPPAPAAAAGAGPDAGVVDVSAFPRHLSKELCRAFASEDNMLIVSFVNAHYMDFARNWVRHLVAAGNRHFLVGALDGDAYSALRSANVPSFDMDASLSTRDFGWGSKVFKQAQQKKIAMFLSVLENGYEVLLSDIDVMYLRDPFVFFRQVPDAHLLISSDLLAPTASDDGPETRKGIGATLNVGILFMRPTRATKRLTKEWNDMCSKNLDFWEQAAFNSLVRRGSTFTPASTDAAGFGDRVFAMYKGLVPTAVLPVALFCSGHTGFVQNLAARAGKRPYAVHATFQFAGTNGKRHRMREWQIWADEPAYYDPPEGLLTLDYSVPQELLRPHGREPRTVEQHFALVNWQLARIRSGLVLAELTGRKLIVPKLWCGFDRWWAPHEGRIPGSRMPLPIQCPLDHVFNIEGGLRPERIREWSLLDNPRTPTEVRSSQHNLTFAKPTTNEGVRSSLKAREATQAKVLRIVDTPDDVYQRVLSESDKDSFRRRAFNYLGIWCCIRPAARGKPGHIWYDLFWDIVPHVDRWRHEWTAPWFPRPSK